MDNRININIGMFSLANTGRRIVIGIADING